MVRTYTELSKIHTLEGRFEYLRLNGKVAETTFDFERWMNQLFYRSPEWRKIREYVTARDQGYEMGLEGYPINGLIVVHHMNAVTVHDIKNRNEAILDPDYLICVSPRVHNAIHYGDANQLPQKPVERRPNDTIGWTPL